MSVTRLRRTIRRTNSFRFIPVSSCGRGNGRRRIKQRSDWQARILIKRGPPERLLDLGQFFVQLSYSLSRIPFAVDVLAHQTVDHLAVDDLGRQ